MFEPSVEIIFNEFKKINNFKKRQVYKIQDSHENFRAKKAVTSRMFHFLMIIKLIQL